ncbi:MAG: hypothetical protein PWQ96_2294 [Clostridia bacterium]|jgi:uncharacterized protein (UPF0332 family)|nr:hypothetical protein [Clostridiales bacterium]MDK2986650.1 hypothetical protein [Clostridia bacterium]
MAGNVEDILYWKNKSEDCLDSAKFLYNKNFYSEAVTMAYYGLIYMIKALFTQDNVRAYKPTTMLTALGRNYVAAGKLGASFHRSIMQVFDIRYKSDFEVHSAVEHETAAHILQLTEEIKQEIYRMLTENNAEENVS